MQLKNGTEKFRYELHADYRAIVNIHCVSGAQTMQARGLEKKYWPYR